MGDFFSITNPNTLFWLIPGFFAILTFERFGFRGNPLNGWRFVFFVLIFSTLFLALERYLIKTFPDIYLVKSIYSHEFCKLIFSSVIGIVISYLFGKFLYPHFYKSAPFVEECFENLYNEVSVTLQNSDIVSGIVVDVFEDNKKENSFIKVAPIQIIPANEADSTDDKTEEDGEVDSPDGEVELGSEIVIFFSQISTISFLSDLTIYEESTE